MQFNNIYDDNKLADKEEDKKIEAEDAKNSSEENVDYAPQPAKVRIISDDFTMMLILKSFNVKNSLN